MKYSEKHKGLKFLAPAGLRLHRYFYGVMVDFDSPMKGYWWSDHYKKWMLLDDIDKGSCSSHFGPCRTLRAFKRHLRNHPEIVGHLRLCNRKVYQFDSERLRADVLSISD